MSVDAIAVKCAATLNLKKGLRRERRRVPRHARVHDPEEDARDERERVVEHDADLVAAVLGHPVDTSQSTTEE